MENNEDFLTPDKEESSAVRVRTCHVYEDHIDRVWEVFTNTEIYNSILGNYVLDMKTTKGKSYADVGTRAEFRCAKLNEIIKKRVKDVENLPETKKIVFDMLITSPFEFKYLMIYTFYWNTIQRRTVFIWDFVFSLPNTHQEYLAEIKIKTEEIDKKIIMKRFEEYLMRHPENLFQEESILINANINQLWEAITDWNIFKNCVPSLNGNLVYQGPPRLVDTIIHLYLTARNAEFHMKVTKVEESEEKREYSMHYFAGLPQGPKQDLTFILYPIGEDRCLVNFRHDFRQWVSNKQISLIENEKKSILMQLKNSFENK
jgi:ribosome-associated toxin RatA of RatAB toxin-antitoxin module